MNQIHFVCVYSASSTKIAPVYFEAAEKLGSLLAKQHIRLINGAGSIGLMRSVADAVLKNGGEVTGVIPHLVDGIDRSHFHARTQAEDGESERRHHCLAGRMRHFGRIA